jgi:dipeptidyl aminopeptidase/acylaminoacyl peptidase
MQAVLSNPESGPTGKAIVLIHGGPARRVSTKFSATVSWLVANGYSVLQPNFRGSSGYGETWRQAGYGEWGRLMQKDVRTAALSLVREGIAQKGAMCVMGGSYGGYAAMMSAIMDDDLFACAISLNGVSSIPHLVGYLNTKRFSQLTVPRIRARLSARTLKRRSPLYRVDLVRMPILLLHATKDQNVPFEHSVLMVKALRKHNKPYEFIILKGAEHVLRRSADRRRYLQKAVEFIGEHIGAVSR